MSFIEILVLALLLFYGVRAVANLVRAVHQDAGAPPGRMGRGPEEGPWTGAREREPAPVVKKRRTRRANDVDIEDARWVDLD